MSQKYSDFAIYDKLYCEISGLSLNRSNLSPNKSLPERVQMRMEARSSFFGQPLHCRRRFRWQQLCIAVGVAESDKDHPDKEHRG